eukprot:1941497-Prymnesium_polylepis.1
MLRPWDELSLAVLQAKPATNAALDRAKIRKERALLDKDAVTVTHGGCTAAELARSAPQLSCRSHRGNAVGRDTPYWQQGDTSLYSTVALQDRMALRRAPQVANALEQWWQAARRSLLHTTRDDILAIDREQYVALYARIHQALVGGTGFGARACGEAEWRHDSHGRPSMSRELFLDAVFALSECATHANRSGSCSPHANGPTSHVLFRAAPVATASGRERAKPTSTKPSSAAFSTESRRRAGCGCHQEGHR